MPRWNGIHTFSRQAEERALDRWSPDPESRGIVLAVTDAVLEVIARQSLGPEHLVAFVRSAAAGASDRRVWGPGVRRLIEAAAVAPALARTSLEALLDHPPTAARFLTDPRQGNEYHLPEPDRVRAVRTLLAADPPARRAALTGDEFRSVRVLVEEVESNRTPGSPEAALDEIEASLAGHAAREPVVLQGEIARGFEPRHAARVLSIFERWPEEDLGGLFDDLADLVARSEGGAAALVESFRRRPSLGALRGIVSIPGDRGVLREALARPDLPAPVRAEIDEAGP